jgi:hypothetical protein
MSLKCRIAAIAAKQQELLSALVCVDEGEVSPFEPVDGSQSIKCQLQTLLDNTCAAVDLTVCECDVEACFTMTGFDYESGGGFWGSGAFQATVNGVATSTPWNFAGTEDKSLGYQAMIDQINATPGWSVTVVTDASMSTTDLVSWRFDYCGDAGDAATLTIVRTSGDDTIVLNAETGVGSFTDSNGEISNDRQPVLCE